MPLFESLYKALTDRINQGNYRKLKSSDGFLDFFSNDYLGLSQKNIFLNSPQSKGSSRLIAGTTNNHLIAEKEFAKHFRADCSLFFNSGYSANIGFFSSIPTRDSIVLFDEYIHASVKDGMRLSLGKSVRFRHNDIQDLERLLKKFSDKNLLIVIESLYSMHGDIAPLREIIDLARKYDAFLFIDEAHAGGVFGEFGEGLTSNELLQGINYVKLITFGKAFGSHGAVILSNQLIKDFLVNFARSFIYTTALPDYIVQQSLANVKSDNLKELQVKLQKNIQTFRSLVKNKEYLKSSEISPIQIIQLESLEKLKQVEEQLIKEKIGVKAIYAPTVPKGEERLRISIHANHKKEDLMRLGVGGF